jgi:hypothetical protein
VRLEGEYMTRRVGIFWHRDRYRSRATETFVEIAREVGAQIMQPAVV